jgi:hypothetical protein
MENDGLVTDTYPVLDTTMVYVPPLIPVIENVPSPAVVAVFPATVTAAPANPGPFGLPLWTVPVRV